MYDNDMTMIDVYYDQIESMMRHFYVVCCHDTWRVWSGLAGWPGLFFPGL